MIIHDLDDWGTMTSESAQLMIKKGAPVRRPRSPEARKSGRWGHFVNGKKNGWCSSNESFYGIFYVMKCCYKHLMQAVQLKYCYGSLSVLIPKIGWQKMTAQLWIHRKCQIEQGQVSACLCGWLSSAITIWLWLTVCHGKSPFLIGKPSISMGHFPWLC